MTFRNAEMTDAAAIAALHAQSWQVNYRNSMSADYLENVAPQERLDVWTARMNNPLPTRWILLAEEDGELLGFICLERDQDQRWGALVDNLHVNGNYQGRGIGRQLMRQGVEHLRKNATSTNFYLWVLTDNTQAIEFYQRVNGRQVGPAETHVLAGNEVAVYRYVWEEPYAF